LGAVAASAVVGKKAHPDAATMTKEASEAMKVLLVGFSIG
jgi:hypothetical protein